MAGKKAISGFHYGYSGVNLKWYMLKAKFTLPLFYPDYYLLVLGLYGIIVVAAMVEVGNTQKTGAVLR